jgi:hypothetical protein
MILMIAKSLHRERNKITQQMSTTKDYKKYMKTVLKDKRFYLKSARRKNTVKLVYIPTSQCYSIHPHDRAINDIRRWVRKIQI